MAKLFVHYRRMVEYCSNIEHHRTNVPIRLCVCITASDGIIPDPRNSTRSTMIHTTSIWYNKPHCISSRERISDAIQDTVHVITNSEISHQITSGSPDPCQTKCHLIDHHPPASFHSIDAIVS